MGLLGGGGSSATVVSTTEAVETNLNTADYREADEGIIEGNLTIATPQSQDSSFNITQTDLGSISGALDLAGKALDYGSEGLASAVEETKVSNQALLSGVDKNIALAAETAKSGTEKIFSTIANYGLYLLLGGAAFYFLYKKVK